MESLRPLYYPQGLKDYATMGAAVLKCVYLSVLLYIPARVWNTLYLCVSFTNLDPFLPRATAEGYDIIVGY